MPHFHEFFATAPRFVPPLLMDELKALGIEDLKESPAGVSFRAGFDAAYRTCLWSRLANRVLWNMVRFPAASPEQLYQAVTEIAWEDHLDVSGSLAVDAHVSRSAMTHSLFVAQKVKDAVVDRFTRLQGARPNVSLDRPSIRINVFIDRDQAMLSLDLSGESLHRRGYRDQGAKAPLKENLASAILVRAGWPAIAARGGALVDPMCGSGTLLIEGALMAADVAPGLLREYFGFSAWRGHDGAVWDDLLNEARQRREAGLRGALPVIFGCDADAAAVRAASDNVAKAGLQGIVRIERRDIRSAAAPESATPGLVVVNPPYGERLGAVQELPELYAALGQTLQQQFDGWEAAVFSGNPDLCSGIGLRSTRSYTLFNGPIECKLLRYSVSAEHAYTPRPKMSDLEYLLSKGRADSEGGVMLANRLRKNQKQLARWRQQQDVSCYRLYDADLPEYAVAVDVYGNDDTWVHVQEYQAPATVDPQKARLRLADVLAVIVAELGVAPDHLFLKVRSRQKGKAQYQKLDEKGEFHVVREGRCRFWVNFEDYLDTGLFLDHRTTRHMIGDMAAGKRFLNLFAYTGTASVHAAMGGAASTTTIDMSATYVDWVHRNFALNDIRGDQHQFLQGDCLAWLEQQASRSVYAPRYDLVFLDPPTFSTSKRMDGTFDVQRDHVDLIRKVMKLVVGGGVLIFSNNRRGFKLDPEVLAAYQVDDITRQTIPQDFARDVKAHSCWIIRHRGERDA